MTKNKLITIIFLSVVSLYGCKMNNHNSAQGYIEGRYTYISSQMTGTLQQLLAERGTKITAKQKIAKLEYNPQKAEYKQALSKLNAAKKRLKNLENSKRETEIAAIKQQQKQAKAKIKFAEITVK